MDRVIIHAVHVAVLGPLLIAIGLGYLVSFPKAIAALGIFIMLYHAFKTYKKLSEGRNPWVNLIHVLVVGPALIAEGLLATPPRWIREVILMLGFAAVGWHGYYLITGDK